MSKAPPVGSALGLTRRAFSAANERDYVTLLKFFGTDSTWDVTRWGLGAHTGQVAIGEFFGDWMGGFDRYAVAVEEIRDLGSGVVYVVAVQAAVTRGGALLHLRYAPVFTWSGTIATCVTHYRDVAEALTAAERLAEERGVGDVGGATACHR